MDIKTNTCYTYGLTDFYTGEAIVIGEEYYETVGGNAVKISTYEARTEQFEVCTDCGNLIDKDSDEYYYDWLGNIICEDCRFEDYFECEECGELHPYDDEIVVRLTGWHWGETMSICPDCAEYSGDYFRCDDCGEWRRGDSHETHDGMIICGECIDRYQYCTDCGEIWPEEEMYYDGWDWHCPECDDGTISGYHNHDRYSLDRFNLAGKMEIPEYEIGDNKYTMGVETEVQPRSGCDYNSSAVAKELGKIMGDRAYFEHDSSLASGGFEMILVPHTYEAFRKCKEFEKALGYLEECGYTSHDNPNCGLHIHVSKWFFGDTAEEQRNNISKVLYMYGKNYEFFKNLSRRTSTYWCENVRFDDCEDARYNMWRAQGHGVAVNVQNLDGIGTVEFRLGRGTLNYATYMAWVDIHMAIARNAKDIPENDIDLNKWLNGISMETRGYILSKTDVLIDIRRNRRVVA